MHVSNALDLTVGEDRPGLARAPTCGLPWLLTFTMLLFIPILARPASARTLKESLEAVAASDEFQEIVAGEGIRVDLRYAGTNNFVGANLYGSFNRLFLRTIAAEKLRKAAALLRRLDPKYDLIVFDGLRPRSVQWELWK